jgi:multidrug efflux pump subunit AcrB
MIVFLPMLALPGIVGKFLAYIPITIFITLAGSLFLASSINNAIFWKLNNNQKYYYKPKDYEEGEDEEVLLSPEDKQLLALEQQGKEARESESQPKTDIFINRVAHRYSTKLHFLLENRFWRITAFI